jgi:hypothetical protein
MTQQEDAGESLLSIMESQIPDTTLTSDIWAIHYTTYCQIYNVGTFSFF